MTRPFLIGLTGSIGMGKSTTAKMFADQGLLVWDADAVVHQLYGLGGAAVDAIGAVRPEAVVDGALDRAVLRAWIATDKTALAQIEQIVHPLVAQDRVSFIAQATAPIVVLDIPLLFETGAQAQVDLIAVVSTSDFEQRRRVLGRPGMTPKHLESILAKQLPNAQKCAKADVVIDTTTLESARQAVINLIAKLKQEHAHA